MSQWTERLRDHSVWQQMSLLGPAIDEALRREALEPQVIDGLERLRTVLAFIGKRLAALDPALCSVGPLDAIGTGLANALNEAQVFPSDGSEAHITAANVYADTALANLASLPTVLGPVELEALGSASIAYRITLEQNLAAARSRVAALEASAEALQSKMADLGTESTATRESLLSQGADFLVQFSAAQSERQASFQKTLTGITENLQGQIDAFKESRQQHTVAQEQNITEIRKETVEKASGILVEVQGYRDEVKVLLDAIAQRGIATDFLGAAAEARFTKRVWQGLTVFALAGLVATSWLLFLGHFNSGSAITWEEIVVRVVLIATVGVFAGFTSAQAERYQEAERRHRQRGMEMATLGPFMAQLTPAEQEKLRVRIGELTFGKDPGAYGQAKRAPTSLLGLVLMNRELNRTVRELISTLGARVK